MSNSEISIKGSVGIRGENQRRDVATVQRLLRVAGDRYRAVVSSSLAINGRCDPKTIRSIIEFQKIYSHSGQKVNGLITGNGKDVYWNRLKRFHNFNEFNEIRDDEYIRLGRFLKDGPVTNSLNFIYIHPLLTIKPSQFRDIGQEIIQRDVAILRFDKRNNTGRLRGSFTRADQAIALNQLIYPEDYKNNKSLEHKKLGVLIHEVTHLIQYREYWGLINVGTAEMMAHIAQAILLLKSNYSDELMNDPKMQAAEPIARKILNGNRRINKDDEDVRNLATVLRKIPSYNKRWNQRYM